MGDTRLIVERLVAGEKGEAHGGICDTDPCLRCAARAAITKAKYL